MSIYVGTSEIKNIYVGTTPVKEVYVGTNKVRPTITERPDINTYTQLSNRSSPVSSPHAVALSSDGTKLYLGPASGAISQYTMTGGLLSNLSSQQSSSGSIATRGMAIKPDGTKLYSVSDNKRRDTITMPTAYSLSGSSISTNSTSLGVSEPNGVWFTPDGTYFFITDGSSGKSVYKVKVNTAWDITTATTSGITSKYLNTFPYNRLYNVAISPTGLKMFIGSWGQSGCGIAQYNLSTARDITTATYSGKTIGSYGRCAFSISGDGKSIIVADTDYSTLYQLTHS